MADELRTFAGDCRIEDRANDRSTYRGRVVVLVKPDGTVLVHDTGGYQPVAWITRADDVTVETDVRAPIPADGTVRTDGAVTHSAEPPSSEGSSPSPSATAASGASAEPSDERATRTTAEPARHDAAVTPFVVTARTADRQLRIVARQAFGTGRYPASGAGRPVGACPDCEAALVTDTGAIRCVACDRHHGLPSGAAVRDAVCDCGLPRVRVERGAAFDVCADRTCDPLDERVRERFDGAWDCPECGAPLRILRRGGLIAGCERYPECETGFAIPSGVVAGECPCGLPAFETGAGRRCLDGTCELT
jgi:DNA topoisomerase-1